MLKTIIGINSLMVILCLMQISCQMIQDSCFLPCIDDGNQIGDHSSERVGGDLVGEDVADISNIEKSSVKLRWSGDISGDEVDAGDGCLGSTPCSVGEVDCS